MMKKTIMMLILCLAVAKLKAQTFTKYADTANYLIHEIGNKKSLFLDKPLSVLLDSLKINIADIYSGNNTAKDDTFGATAFFEFNHENKFEKSHYMIIHFKNPPPFNQAFALFFPTAGGRGTVTDIISIYNSVMIKDIIVKDYLNDDPVNPDVHY